MTDASAGNSGILMVAPYLRCQNAAAAIDFYKRAFGATEVFRLAEPSGRVGHAELKFGQAMIMVSDEYPEHNIFSPLAFGGVGSSVHLQVANVDEVVASAVAAGAKVSMPATDQFYGMRHAKVVDPYGHEWSLGQSIEKVSNEEVQRRYDDLLSQKSTPTTQN